jgi:hypothetical protein
VLAVTAVVIVVAVIALLTTSAEEMYVLAELPCGNHSTDAITASLLLLPLPLPLRGKL